MAEISEAERYLVEGIRGGSADAWSQLVDRYRGRLLAFARTRLPDAADAEDAVQDTFLRFLRGLKNYRQQASLETFLFTICRNRIADHYRGARPAVCSLGDSDSGDSGSSHGRGGGLDRLPADDPTASTYARKSEQTDLQREALAAALGEYAGELQTSLNFRDLKIAEMLFYCQLPNPRVAELSGVNARHVALIKHRAIQRIRQSVQRARLDAGASDPPDSLLTEIWEVARPSCPKRNTIGAWLLGTLEPDWADYVKFHLDTLGCRFCLANYEDLRRRTEADPAPSLRRKILQSTVGFLPAQEV